MTSVSRSGLPVEISFQNRGGKNPIQSNENSTIVFLIFQTTIKVSSSTPLTVQIISCILWLKA